jgi:hypothetical protein
MNIRTTFVGANLRCCGITEKISDEFSLFLTFGSRPITEALLHELEIFGALYALSDLCIILVKAARRFVYEIAQMDCRSWSSG